MTTPNFEDFQKFSKQHIETVTAVTSTVTDRVSMPPVPLAGRVYVVVCAGKTWRFPLAWIAPSP